MFDVSVPSLCTYGLRSHVDVTLLSVEMIVNTEIVKIFAMEGTESRLEVGRFCFLAIFSLQREKSSNFKTSYMYSTLYSKYFQDLRIDDHLHVL